MTHCTTGPLSTAPRPAEGKGKKKVKGDKKGKGEKKSKKGKEAASSRTSKPMRPLDISDSPSPKDAGALQVRCSAFICSGMKALHKKTFTLDHELKSNDSYDFTCPTCHA